MSRAKRHSLPYLFADLGMTERESPTDGEMAMVAEAMHRRGARCRVIPWCKTLKKTLAGLDRYVAERDTRAS